ncbi:hypothetical protein GMB26_12765, partial [Turicibacter sanguinis]|nr:hypothetical protein [Turicibacter sanguinis]
MSRINTFKDAGDKKLNKFEACPLAKQLDNNKFFTKSNHYDSPITRLADKGKESNEGIENFKRLKNTYIDDLREKSPCPGTLKSVDINHIEKLSPEVTKKRRSEFNNNRNTLIKEWEKKYDRTWPTYSNDIIGKNGTIVRYKGQGLEAHHIKPLSLGGENSGENITPMHYNDHNDHRGIHSN